MVVERGGGGRYRVPACFNVLNPEGASGTYRVETRIPCAVFLSAFIRYLKNQYRDLETRGLDGPARSRLK